MALNFSGPLARASRRFVLGAAALTVLSAAVPAFSAEVVKVSLNAPFDGSNAAFFLAEERGYYKAEGIEPAFDPSGGSGEVATRIGSGTYDFGFGDINVLLEFNAKNPDNAGKALYMLYYRSPLSIGSFAKAGISKASDLPGKKLGGSLGDGAYKLWPVYAGISGIKADSVVWSYGDLRLREAMLLKGDVDGILGFDSTIYFNLVRQGIKPEDIKFLYYSDAGMDIYGNAILASKKMLTERPAVVNGFIKATAKGWQDAIKDPKAAIAVLKKKSSLVNEALELEKLEWLIKNQLVTAESKADGMGNVNAERFGKSVTTVSTAFGLPNVKPADVFDASYLPDASIRKLP
ncbi:MAG: ABC transporter substrate-binding protein [Pseudolabrys sp.]|nr:ABC transporter substrate-binding protein [Pseudolabrys sp.]